MAAHVAVKASGAYAWHLVPEGAPSRAEALCGWAPGVGQRVKTTRWKRVPSTGRARWLYQREAQHADCLKCRKAAGLEP